MYLIYKQPIGSLTITVGFPAAGKSTLLTHKQVSNYVVLSPDDFRWIISGQQFYQPAEEFVWAAVKTAARALVYRHDVIIDGTHLTVASRRQWVMIAQAIDVPIYCWHLDVPFEVCVERNNQRTHPVPAEAMERMRMQYEAPTLEEGFNGIYQVAKISENEIVWNSDMSQNVAKVSLEQELG